MASDISYVLKGLRNPRAAARKIKRDLRRAAGAGIFKLRFGERTNAMTEDWDNLLILDGCRYDTFASVHNLPGTFEARYSVGTGTLAWLHNAVGDEEFHDTVYVTANPRVSRYDGQFHDVVHAWKTHWDDDVKVVPPEPLADLAIEAFHQYPDKRIVVHFMQPHIPFIGAFGRSEIGIYSGTTKGVRRASGLEYELPTTPDKKLERGELSRADFVTAYRENLEVVLPAVERLLETLDGKSVVTSDHGEMYGDRAFPFLTRLYGHSFGDAFHTPVEGLLKVPWLEYTNGQRRSITEEGPVEASPEEIDQAELEEKLEHLGYR